MSPKRILIFSLAYSPMIGGAEIAIKEITDRISGIEFDVVTLRFSKSHSRVEKMGNVTVYRIGGGMGYLSKILFVPQAALWARNSKYNAYWAMMTNMSFPIALVRLIGNRIPYALTLQDGDPFERVFERKRIKIFLPLLKYAFGHASVIQTISNFLAEWPRKLGYKGRIEVIPNGVEVERFKYNGHKNKNLDKTVIITTSRLYEKNAVGDIIESLKFLPDNVTLKILGSGPLESKLKALTRSLNLESRVEFMGFISQSKLPGYLHEADIFVRPSLSEGQGISFIEAMAAGLPVIATPVGGIVDFLKDGETGLFCKINDPESIAAQVKTLMADSTLKENIVRKAHKIVQEKYDWNLIAKDMENRVFNPILL